MLSALRGLMLVQAQFFCTMKEYQLQVVHFKLSSSFTSLLTVLAMSLEY